MVCRFLVYFIDRPSLLYPQKNKFGFNMFNYLFRMALVFIDYFKITKNFGLTTHDNFLSFKGSSLVYFFATTSQCLNYRFSLQDMITQRYRKEQKINRLNYIVRQINTRWYNESVALREECVHSTLLTLHRELPFVRFFFMANF